GPSTTGPSAIGLSTTGLFTAGPAGRPPATGQATLFGPAEPGIAEAREVLRALVGVQADQLRPIAADAHPARFALLAALLGRRPVPGFRPPRLAELATQISAALAGRPVTPHSPAQLLKAFATVC